MANVEPKKYRGPRKDISGHRFGRWTVLSFAGSPHWLCRCDCGVERRVSGGHLKSGHSVSCGCFKSENSSRVLSLDIAGRRFGRLVAVSDVGSARNSRLWRCRCDCGNEATVQASRLNTGYTQSCGCLQRDRTRTHGQSRTRTYRIWIKMRGRCHNPKNDNWPNYGGRGIVVCDRWRDSFEAFIADMGAAPSGLSLDRRNNNGNYEPDNCRWATSRMQLRNTRRNRSVTIDGTSMLLTDAIALLRRRAKPLE